MMLSWWSLDGSAARKRFGCSQLGRELAVCAPNFRLLVRLCCTVFVMRCSALLCCVWTVPIRRPPSEGRREGGIELCLCLLVPIAQISLVCSLSPPEA